MLSSFRAEAKLEHTKVISALQPDRCVYRRAGNGSPIVTCGHSLGFLFLERRIVDMCFVSKDKAAKQIAASRPGALTLRRTQRNCTNGQCIPMPFGDNFQLYGAVRDLAAG